MWDILLATKDAAKLLFGSILTTNSVRMQREYMGIRKTNMILHGVPLYITEEHLGYVFVKFSEVANILFIKRQTNITTSDVEIIVTLTRKSFMEIPNVLIYGSHLIYVVVEGRHLFWFCGAARHLSESCIKPTSPATPEKAVGLEKSDQTPSSSSEWTNVVRRRKKSASPSPVGCPTKKGSISNRATKAEVAFKRVPVANSAANSVTTVGKARAAAHQELQQQQFKPQQPMELLQINLFMELEEIHPLQSSTLKRGREEEDISHQKGEVWMK